MTRPLDDTASVVVVAAPGAPKGAASRDGKKKPNSNKGALTASTTVPSSAAAAAAASSSMARGFARLDPETTAYFTEARETLNNLLREGDNEQASLLAGAALREAASPTSAGSSKATTSDVAADAVASRALEEFLPIASSEDVLEFARCVLADPETLRSVALR